MSQTKYKLPDDLKIQCTGIVRGYERRVKTYHLRREGIMYSSPSPNIEEFRDKDGKLSGMLRERSSKLSDSTADKAIKLEEVEHLLDTKLMRAVEQAKKLVGTNYDESSRKQLANAIYDSCVNGRNFQLEYYNVPLERSSFYEHRRKFLFDVAQYLELT